MSTHHDRERARLLTEQDRLVSESVLDRAIRLGFPRAAHPECGPNIVRYFAEKHRRGEYGTYFPLHETAMWSRS